MRTSARRLFLLHAVFAAAGLVVALGAIAVASRMVSFGVPSVAQTLAACRSWLSSLHPLALLVFALGTTGLAVIVRALITAVRMQRSTRAYMRSLQTLESTCGDPPVQVVGDPTPLAFCAGLLWPRVYVSSGALERLSRQELRAVLAHEAHHAACRDPLRLLVARALGEGLFFLPAMRRMWRQYATAAELAADEAAVSAGGGRQPLAAAMLAFGESGHPGVVGVSPERIDHRLGARRPMLPVWLLFAAGATLVGLGILVFAGARAGAGAHISLMLWLMHSCGPLMLALPSLMLPGCFAAGWPDNPVGRPACGPEIVGETHQVRMRRSARLGASDLVWEPGLAHDQGADDRRRLRDPVALDFNHRKA